MAENAAPYERPIGVVRGASLAAVLACAACSSEPETPPPYTRPPLDNPRTCVEVRELGVPSGNDIFIDGKRAVCAVDGLECPLLDSGEVVRRCDGGGARASCVAELWRFRCTAIADASAGDAP